MRLRILIIAFTILFSLNSYSQFRVIGYIHLNKSAAALDSVQFEKITHLNIAFVNPDSTGALVVPYAFDTTIQKARQYRVKILASLGGGTFNPYLVQQLKEENRKAFIMQIVKLVTDYKLDGIDIDIENDNLDPSYNRFIAELAPEIKKLKKLLTAAVATGTGERIENETLKFFDFINVMSYDQTGPWRKDYPGPHSTYEKAVSDLAYWSNRGISRKKLNLGLPFYGYCFGTPFGESMSFREISERFPAAVGIDQYRPTEGGTIYYNGIPTIQAKTLLATKKAGGVMCWQLLQDGVGDNSLLNAILNRLKF